MTTMTKEAPSGAMREITELDVEEVSLVDHPANKRPFLIVKSANQMAERTQLFTNQGGGLSSVEKSFDANSKKAFRVALTSASTSVTSLLASLDSSDDEVSFTKEVAGVTTELGKVGTVDAGQGVNTSSSETSVAVVELSTEPVSPSIDMAQLAQLSETSRIAAQHAEVTKKAESDAAKFSALEEQIERLTKASKALPGVAVTPSARPPSQTGSTDPIVVVAKSGSLWPDDMASAPIPDDEQFV